MLRSACMQYLYYLPSVIVQSPRASCCAELMTGSFFCVLDLASSLSVTWGADGLLENATQDASGLGVQACSVGSPAHSLPPTKARNSSCLTVTRANPGRRRAVASPGVTQHLSWMGRDDRESWYRILYRFADGSEVVIASPSLAITIWVTKPKATAISELR